MSRLSRWILLICLVGLVAGLGWAGYERYSRQTLLRVAISDSRTDDGQIVEELNKWLVKNDRKTRLQVITLANEAAVVEAVRTGKAEWGSVRGDTPLPGGLNSALALYREVAVIVATPQSRITDWAQLRGRTIGLAGHVAPDDPLLQKILSLRNVSDVKMLRIETNQIDELLKRNAIHAVAQIAPLIGAQTTNLKAGRTMRRVRGNATMLEIADAEAVAAADNRYEDYDVPVGAIRDAPPLPEEATSTLAVIRHLIVRSNVPALFVQRSLIDIMDAKRAIAPEFPLARQIGSPGVDKDAAVKIHAGAVSYFNGEELKLTDMLIEWVYVVPLVIGGLGALLTWLYNLFWPADGRRAQNALVELLVMRRDASRATTIAEIDKLELRYDEIQDMIHDDFSDGNVDDNIITALLVASESADRKIDFMRQQLAQGRASNGSADVSRDAGLPDGPDDDNRDGDDHDQDGPASDTPVRVPAKTPA